MSDSNLSQIEKPSNKSVGLLFFIIFLFLGILVFVEIKYRVSSLTISFLFFVGVVFKQSWIKVVNVIWFNIGIKLGSIVAPIVISLIYVTTIIPIGLLLKMFNIDVVHLKKNENIKTYWIKRKDKIQPFKNQF